MDKIDRKGKIQLKNATALQRVKPSSASDFTFIIKVPGRDWTLDPGNLQAWQEWEQKLLPMLGGE